MTETPSPGLSAATVFLLLALLAGTAYALLLPPFQPADEGTHLFRAWQISSGGLLARFKDGVPGGELPVSLPATVEPYKVMLFKPTVRLPAGLNERAWHTPLAPAETVFVPFPNTAPYAPPFYAPAVIGVWLGRLCGGPVLLALYLARLAGVLAYALIGWLALRRLPTRQWAVCWLLLLPMPLALAAAVSVDALVLAVCLLFLALCLDLRRVPDQPLTPRDRAWLWGTGLLVALAKFAYAPLLLLYFLIPRRRWATPAAYWRHTLAFFAVTGAVFLGWAWLVRDMHAASGPGVAAGEQVAWIAAHPLGYAGALAQAYLQEPLRLLYAFVGILGHLDTPIATLHFLLALFLLGFAALVDTTTDAVPPRTARAGLLALVLLVTLLISTLMYLTWTPVGKATIDGLQGRYFLPLAPLLLVALGNRIFILTRPAPVRVAYTVAAVGSTLWALLVVWQRYYGP